MSMEAVITVQPAADPIYVDSGPLRERHLTGIGRFVARLVEALVRRRSVCLFRADGRGDVTLAAMDEPGCDLDLAGWARRLLRRPGQRHNQALAERSAAIWTALRPAQRHFRRELGILYDFTPVLLPWAHAESTRAHFGSFFGKESSLCDKLVAISQSTKHDASWLCALPNEHVVVGYPGPSLCVRQHAHTQPVARRENVILVVSTLEPRKNGPFLLDWFCTTQALPADMELWWVGPKGWWSSNDWLGEVARRRRGNDSRRVHLCGMVSDARLCALYQQATFTIYPSLYEGFGFPVLDSLLHGAPVACSYNSSLKEFEDTGAFFFDAADPGSVDDACRALLAARPVPIDESALRKRFSWDALADTVLKLCA
jgi:glycosyltransferase involved in cell wall biosynthesis